jgi:hypothetical protein
MINIIIGTKVKIIPNILSVDVSESYEFKFAFIHWFNPLRI